MPNTKYFPGSGLQHDRALRNATRDGGLAQWARALARSQPLRNTVVVKGMLAGQLPGYLFCANLPKAYAAIAAIALQLFSQDFRQTIDDSSLRSVSLWNLVIELTQILEVFWREVAVHKFYDLILEETALQSEVVGSISVWCANGA